MIQSKLSKNKQLKLIEHFAAGTTARTASATYEGTLMKVQ